MNGVAAVSGWKAASRPPSLREASAHVWRIQVDRPGDVDALFPVLSAAERARANAFHFASHRTRYVIAHGMVRRILGDYAGLHASALTFDVGEHGKPSLRDVGVEFNLAHSGDLALLAVSASGPVGVDVEAWSDHHDHLDIASQFFSPAECASLSALAGSPRSVREGFFSAWTRKEAYLKATGDGITRGLDHFDVSLTPGEPARLLADRFDSDATTRWVMTSIPAAVGYSAALVVAAPSEEIVLLETQSSPNP